MNICEFNGALYRYERAGNQLKLRRLSSEEAHRIRESGREVPSCFKVLMGIDVVYEYELEKNAKRVINIHLNVTKFNKFVTDGVEITGTHRTSGRVWRGKIIDGEKFDGKCVFDIPMTLNVRNTRIYEFEDKCVLVQEQSGYRQYATIIVGRKESP